MDIKKVALKLAEHNAEVLIKEVIRPFAEEYIKKSENKVDDIILPFMDQLEKAMLDLAEKIDDEIKV
jgi:hypothetical protein